MLVSWDDKSLINHQISLPSDSAQPNSQRVPSVAIGQGQGVADGVARPNGQREEMHSSAPRRGMPWRHSNRGENGRGTWRNPIEIPWKNDKSIEIPWKR